MTIPSPILDDRSYAQLRDELIRRIPVYNPEWSDHNASDPGMTLLELVSYLGETLLFRFNQIPEATKLEFLRLLQISRRPPAPARALLRLRPEQLDPVLVAPGTGARAGDLAFETQTEVRALPVSALAVCKSVVTIDADAEPERFHELQRVIDALDGLESDEEAATYDPLLVDIAGKAPPVDFDAAVDGVLWIALLVEGNDSPSAIRQLLRAHPEAPLLLNIGFVPDLAAPAPEAMSACPGDDPQGQGRAVEWQISSGRLDPDGEPIYSPLRVAGDSTGGLEREGVVRLELPSGAETLGVFDVDPDRRGTGELPPPLSDDQEMTLVCWIRAFRRDGAGFGKIQWIGANMTEVLQLRRARTAFLGTGDGQPGQQASLIHTPVLPGSVVVEVEEPEGWTTWTEVDSFHASSEHDRHFVVEPLSGKLRFGNGLQGRAPQYGQRIRARSWQYGGGEQGNVAAAAISELVGVANVKVDNPLPAWGGAPAESVAQALERIPGELRRRDRCVARDDFSELALQAPGTDLGRAEVLPRFYPPTRSEGAAGVVSVVVWPRTDAAHPQAPLPDRRTLQRVCQWLDGRRLVTTELYVIPPRYVKVAVSIGLVVKVGHPIEGVRRWAELIVRQYLAPLPPYGPEGKGWPLGRRVIAGELEAAVLQVEGVEYVRNLRLASWRDDGGVGRWVEVLAGPAAAAPAEAAIELRLDEVPELGEITVLDAPALTPGAQVGAPKPPRRPVPVPIEQEEC